MGNQKKKKISRTRQGHRKKKRGGEEIAAEGDHTVLEKCISKERVEEKGEVAKRAIVMGNGKQVPPTWNDWRRARMKKGGGENKR